MHRPVPHGIGSSTATWAGMPSPEAVLVTARSVSSGPQAYTTSAPRLLDDARAAGR